MFTAILMLGCLTKKLLTHSKYKMYKTKINAMELFYKHCVLFHKRVELHENTAAVLARVIFNDYRFKKQH